MKPLEEMDVDELKQLIREAEKQLGAAERRQFKRAREAVERAAAEHGYSLTELLKGVPNGPLPGQKAEARYAHPENPELTWTGRGRVPAWLAEAIEGDLATMSPAERRQAYEPFLVQQ